MVRRQLGRLALRCLEDVPISRVTSCSSESGVRASNKTISAAPAQYYLQQRRGIVLPAQEESYDTEPTGASYSPALETRVDHYGGVSVIAETDAAVRQGIFQNRDGHRFEDGRYAAFTKVS